MFSSFSARSRETAKNKLRGIRRRKTWHKIAEDLRAKKPVFVAELIEETDAKILDDPHEAYLISQCLPELAERISTKRYGGEQIKLSYIVWAWAVRGSACRASGNLAEAKKAFETARDLMAGALPWAKGEFSKRFGVFLGVFRDIRSLEYIDRAFALLEGFPVPQAESLVLKGALCHILDNQRESSFSHYSAALELLENSNTDRAKRAWVSACYNTAVDLSAVDQPEPLRKCLSDIRKIKSSLGTNATFRRKQVDWLEGLILAGLGSLSKSFRKLLTTWEWFLEKKHSPAAVVLAIDLWKVAHANKIGDVAQDIIARTRATLQDFKDEEGLIAILDRWLVAEPAIQAEIKIGLMKKLASWNPRLVNRPEANAE